MYREATVCVYVRACMFSSNSRDAKNTEDKNAAVFKLHKF